MEPERKDGKAIAAGPDGSWSGLAGPDALPPEDRLRRSEDSYKVLVGQISEYAIFMLDPEGIIVSWNSGAQRLKGYTPEEAIGKSFEMFYPERERISGHPRELLATAVRRGSVREEGWRVRKDGKRFWADVTLTALHDPEGGLYGFAKVTRDMTERRKTESEIRELNASLERRVRERTAELEAANRELDAFAYSVSHDLKAPLRAISGYSEVLQRDQAERLDEDGRQSLARIQAASQRMGHLIEDLLKLSRVSRADLRREEVDLSTLARSVAEELARRYPDRKVDFRAAPGLRAHGDPRLLRVALENLLGNAWKFTRDTPDARVDFSASAGGGPVAYTVRDNGAGFDMRYAGKLFGAFQRLHPVSRFEGTGIGLATVQRIVRRHGGKVWAEGKEGQGAAFSFTLSGED